MTRPDFDRQMTRMLGLRFPPADMGTHWEGLADLPLDRLKDAVSLAIRTRVDFPTPAELRADADARRPQEGPPLPASEEILAEPVELGILPDGTRLPAATRLWRYYCETCSDTGWHSRWCGPGASHHPWLVDRGDCGRYGEHGGHEWVTHCGCYDTNPKLVRERERNRSYAQQAAPVGRSARR